jgi:hypothetical protein
MKNFFLCFFLLSNSAFASALIGEFDISRDFNAHQGTRAQELGFPLSPTLVSMKVYREDIFAGPRFEITYKTSQNSPVILATGSAQVLSRDSQSAVLRMAIAQHGEFGAACGPHDMKILYVVFRIGLQAEFANGHRFLGVHEQTPDNCHSPLELEEITYTIDE